MDTLPPEKNQQCLNSIIEHWAESRIDGPMEALARYDDAAKYMITIGGFLQTALIAVYTALDKQGLLFHNKWQIALVVIFELSLVGFVTLSALACSVQPEMGAKNISSLLIQALKQCLSETELVNQVVGWCREIETKINRKERLMKGAKALYVLSIISMPGLLLFPLMR